MRISIPFILMILSWARDCGQLVIWYTLFQPRYWRLAIERSSIRSRFYRRNPAICVFLKIWRFFANSLRWLHILSRWIKKTINGFIWGNHLSERLDYLCRRFTWCDRIPFAAYPCIYAFFAFLSTYTSSAESPFPTATNTLRRRPADERQARFGQRYFTDTHYATKIDQNHPCFCLTQRNKFRSTFKQQQFQTYDRERP